MKGKLMEKKVRDKLRRRTLHILEQWGNMEANLTAMACRSRIADEIMKEVDEVCESPVCVK